MNLFEINIALKADERRVKRVFHLVCHQSHVEQVRREKFNFQHPVSPKSSILLLLLLDCTWLTIFSLRQKKNIVYRFMFRWASQEKIPTKLIDQFSFVVRIKRTEKEKSFLFHIYKFQLRNANISIISSDRTHIFEVNLVGLFIFYI